MPRLTRKERIGLAIHRGLDKHLSPLGIAVYRRTKGRVTRAWDVDALLLTTTGRRSGKQRTVVLQFFRDGDDMVLAAADAGAESHPGWYHNLTANPEARVDVMGTTIPVTATEMPAEEAEAFWPRILEKAPDYERYLRATDRRMPLIRLTPRPG
jgi:deazaflavin-dependent oxidoreductase (nitroreductase family)